MRVILEDALRSGRYRGRVFADKTGDFGEGGYPIVDEDEPWINDGIVELSLA